MKAAFNKKEILDKILKSDTFKNSQTYQNLLIYLVDASIKNETPKEYDIAIDVFGRDANFNPAEDPSIRVYISNLRKKLKKYYSVEGKRDKIVLDIPPGHYVVEFVTKKSSRSKSIFSKQSALYATIVLLVLAIGLILFLPSKTTQTKIKGKKFLESVVWTDFVQSNNRLLVILGDDYFIGNSKSPENGIHRFHNVNSEADFDSFIVDHPEYKKYSQTPYTFTPHLSLIPLVKILPLLCVKSQHNIKIESSSRIKTADFLENDLLFIGSFRNLYITGQLLNGFIQRIKLGTGRNELTLKLKNSLKTYTLEGYPKIRHTDYCLVRKIPGPKNNTILLIISFFETGISQASTYMTNPTNLHDLEKAFEDKYGEMPTYFDCLFKVSGLERTGLTIQIEYLSRIAPQRLNIW